MESHKIWIEQWEAARGIKDEFGVQKALDYHIGEKFLRPACPACGGQLIEIRARLQCCRCHTIYETCCEEGRG